MSSEITQKIASYKAKMSKMDSHSMIYMQYSEIIRELENKLPKKVNLHVAEEAMCEACQ